MKKFIDTYKPLPEGLTIKDSKVHGLGLFIIGMLLIILATLITFFIVKNLEEKVEKKKQADMQSDNVEMERFRDLE